MPEQPAKPAHRPPAKVAEATHYLHLADGSVVESAGAIPTHVATGDQVLPVVAAYEKR